MSEKYQEYHDKYMLGRVAIESLNKLVKAKFLTQAEVDTMVADREKIYGKQEA